MKKAVLIIAGIVLAVVGVVWTLQGLNALGQTGGMNGHKIYAVIGVIVAIIGIVLLIAGIRTRRRSPVA